MRGVESGETYLVTKNGRPIAQVVPVTAERPSLPISRMAHAAQGLGLAVLAPR